ncbi:TRAP transporter substrate-binding protein [Halalkalibacter akibai]|uniref:TRAP-type C4-dicarboxylate transport system n=1 Tax=Halalkalibacter akibai (strain ATCC 43226 / DSM 21942 / CIP 109018 / JCM 9157 / 1139) TaxID=1236973 RepID=W4QNP2_HALA3|nr:TRAP transporter substrate-binding protein [Halalkalibacter akibai]GAE33735.1 TRAP-type C4-dicarboxylate transport system [Halalkalibacter akibai JCM 9157]
MKKKKLGFFLVPALALMLTACGGGGTTEEAPEAGGEAAAPAGETKVIRAGIGLNDQHPQYLGLLRFKELVEERTEGAIEVQTYHSGQLGDDRTMTEGLQLGSQEVTIPSTAPIANFVPEYSLFDFPFLFPSEEVADTVLDGEMGQRFLDMLPAQNLVGLAYWENGFRNLTNDVRPVASAEDMKGLKIRTMENELHLEAFRALGANPTPMAFTELFAALQQGTVDGQENPYATIYLQKYQEVQDHVSNTQHIYSPFVFLMSKTFFDGLTPEQQEIVQVAAVEAGQYQRELNREANNQYLADLQEEGMTFTEISEEARQEMVDLIAPVLEKYAERIGEDLVQEMYDAIEAAQQ